jgi:hypothetical protein
VITVTIRLNGTDTNPWHKMGLKQNPFPQMAKAEYAGADMLIASLDGEPIKDEDDLRKRLTGCSQQFIDLCVQNFKKGERTSFEISFPEPNEV